MTIPFVSSATRDGESALAICTPDRPGEAAGGSPIASVIMANYNGAAYLAEAIRSLQQQTLHDLEIIVSDDGSHDRSCDIVARFMAEDPRVRLIQSTRNCGPAAARNKALVVARGEWIAVMDSDDVMHPDRLRSLIEAARRDQALLIADNVIEFHEDGPDEPRPLLKSRWAARPRWVSIVDYVRGTQLGYLKPVFHASILGGPLRYDEGLTIGEDYDLVARVLHSGRRLRLYPSALYFYRRHRRSISRQPNKAALVALKAANLKFLESVSRDDRSLIAAVTARTRSIETLIRFHKLTKALKARRWARSIRIALSSPRAAARLRFPAGLRIRRLASSATRAWK